MGRPRAPPRDVFLIFRQSRCERGATWPCVDVHVRCFVVFWACRSVRWRVKAPGCAQMQHQTTGGAAPAATTLPGRRDESFPTRTSMALERWIHAQSLREVAFCPCIDSFYGPCCMLSPPKGAVSASKGGSWSRNSAQKAFLGGGMRQDERLEGWIGGFCDGFGSRGGLFGGGSGVGGGYAVRTTSFWGGSGVLGRFGGAERGG